MQYDYSPLSEVVTKENVSEYKTLYKLPSNLSIFILPIAFAIVSGISLIFIMQKSNGAGLIVVGLIALLIAYLTAKSYRAAKKLKEYRVKLWKFTKKNNISYRSEDYSIAYDGDIFRKGENRCFYDILNFNDVENRPVEISNYKFDIRTSSRDSDGKETTSTTTYRQGYILIKLNRKLPHIILDSKKNGSGAIANNMLFLDQSQKLALEGDFNDYFDLYVPNGYERDALYIFTPDVMAVFVDETDSFDAEIIDDNLFIYSRTPFNLVNQTVLERLYKLIDVVSKKTLEQTENYADERVGARQENIIAPDGRRLKSGLPRQIIIILAVIVGFNILSFILSLFSGR